MMRRLFSLLLLCVSCAGIPRIEGASELSNPLAAVVQELTIALPLTAPFDVQLVELSPPYLGLTNLLDGRLVMLIERHQGFQGILDTLIHEWAHAYMWPCRHRDPHDELWGAAFSRCYRAAQRALDNLKTDEKHGRCSIQ
jgi:hypothetical protein